MAGAGLPAAFPRGPEGAWLTCTHVYYLADLALGYVTMTTVAGLSQTELETLAAHLRPCTCRQSSPCFNFPGIHLTVGISVLWPFFRPNSCADGALTPASARAIRQALRIGRGFTNPQKNSLASHKLMGCRLRFPCAVFIFHQFIYLLPLIFTLK